MADTDMKPLSELDLYNNKLDYNSLLPMTVKPGANNITRKIYFDSLKTNIIGYELTGVLTAGSTSITLPSTSPNTYDPTSAYNVGDRVTITDDDEVLRNYICVHNCSASQWSNNGRYFVEYSLPDSNSTIEGIFTSVPNVNYTGISIANNSITITFPSQVSDINVKVRVS